MDAPRHADLDRQLQTLLAAASLDYRAAPASARHPDPASPLSPDAIAAREAKGRLESLARRRLALADQVDGDLGRSGYPPIEDARSAAAAWLRSTPTPNALDAGIPADPVTGASRVTADEAAALIAAAAANPDADLAAIVQAAGLGVDVLSALEDKGIEIADRGTLDPNLVVEVLVPLRIETRFVQPSPQQPNWELWLRVFPDEASMARIPHPPTKTELDRVDECLAAPFRTTEPGEQPFTETAAFARLAAQVGARRGAWLLRSLPIEGGAVPRVARASVHPTDHVEVATHRPLGLPSSLDVWLITTGNPPALVETLVPDLAAIDADLDVVERFSSAAGTGVLPEVWWTSFQRALDVELAAKIPIGPDRPVLDSVVVCGVGTQAARELFDVHAASGRLAVLPFGTPTNTVAGEPTTDLGTDPAIWASTVAGTGCDQFGSTVLGHVIGGAEGESGSPAPTCALPTDVRPERLIANSIVEATWPALWGRALRDVAGVGPREDEIARWAARHLVPNGPYPTIRIGAQPYGILPVTSTEHWMPHGTDPQIEARLRDWIDAWQYDAAASVEQRGNVVGADTERFLDLIADDAPTRHWAARLTAPSAVANAVRAAGGLTPAQPERWDVQLAATLRGGLPPRTPTAPISGIFDLPDRRRADPVHLTDDPAAHDEYVKALLSITDDLFEHSEVPPGGLDLLGHVLLEAVTIARAETAESIAVGGKNGFDSPVPLGSWAVPPQLFSLAFGGKEEALQIAEGDPATNPRAEDVGARLHRILAAAREVVMAWADAPELTTEIFQAVLDASAFRVDPWITGMADRRLRWLADRVPFRVGAYGWVDAPAPFPGVGAPVLPPGPTTAGLLHAPSTSQALTAALLRDAAVRYPGDGRWQITLESAKVREAIRLAERVRLGVHPYEALGLEVERAVGDWNLVRTLREQIPLRSANRGVCDGREVLHRLFAEQQTDLSIAGFPDLTNALRPVQDVLDTYADLLMTDGVHALVTGHPDVANAAMEAAAGLGSPPDLRAMDTPRQATSVRVSAWGLLHAAAVPTGDVPPAVSADPHVAALIDEEVGPAPSWAWTATVTPTVGGPAPPQVVDIAPLDLGLHAVELLGLPEDRLTALVTTRVALPPGAVVVASPQLGMARRLVELLGGGDDGRAATDAKDTRDQLTAGSTTVSAQRPEVCASLRKVLARLVPEAVTALSSVDLVMHSDPPDPDRALAVLDRWGVRSVAIEGEADGGVQRAKAGQSELQQRLDAAATVADSERELRTTIRALVGNAALPVAAAVPVEILPESTRAPETGGHPSTDQTWLEIVATVHPALAVLEAHQFTSPKGPWPAAVATSAGSQPPDPWAIDPHPDDGTRSRWVVVEYGPGVPTAVGRAAGDQVAVVTIDSWSESVPSAQHRTSAAFGFNGPKARAPQAILLAVPPDLGKALDAQGRLDIVLEARRLARARLARPDPVTGDRVVRPSSVLSASGPTSIDSNWP